MRTFLLAPALFASTFIAAQLVINEVDYDQVATDNAEYLEIKNVGDAAFPLSTIKVVMINGNNGGAVEYRTVQSATWPDLEPGGYFVICANQGLTLNCDHIATPATNLIQNGSPDAIASITVVGDEIIDVMSYGGSVPGYVEGTGTDVEDTNLQDGISLSRFPDGVDSNDNSADFVISCPTPGETNEVDPLNCAITVGIEEAGLGQSFTILPTPGGDRLLVNYGSKAPAAVTFSVFTANGALVVEEAVPSASQVNWSFSTADLHGQLLLVRATTANSSITRKALMP